MIVQWKRRDNTEFTARWNGLVLRLTFEPQAAHAGPWRLYVDGKLVSQRWFTPVAAMNAVETTQTKLILAQSAVVVALQRRGTEVRHGNATQG